MHHKDRFDDSHPGTAESTGKDVDHAGTTQPGVRRERVLAKILADAQSGAVRYVRRWIMNRGAE